MPAWLNRALTRRLSGQKRRDDQKIENKILMRVGDRVSLPKDVDVYVFNDTEKANVFAAGVEYPEELDAAVDSGLAVKGNAKNLIESIPPGAFVWLASNM